MRERYFSLPRNSTLNCPVTEDESRDCSYYGVLVMGSHRDAIRTWFEGHGLEARGMAVSRGSPRPKTGDAFFFRSRIPPRHMLADNAHFQGINHGLQVSMSWSISCQNEARGDRA